VEQPNLETIAALLTRDLGTARGSYSAEVQGSVDPDIAFCIEGTTDLWLHLWHTDDWVEELANAVDQVQDVVMEHEAELWPECPLHRHALIPTPRDGRVVWECMEAEQVFA